MRPALTEDVQKILQGRYWSARAQRDRRQAEVYAKHPELEAIDLLEAKTAYAILASAASENGCDFSPLREIKEKRARYLRDHNLRGDYAEVIPFCRHCGDTGSVDGVLCDCARQIYLELKPQWFDAGLNREETFARADLSLYADPADRAHMKTLFSIAQDYVHRFFELIDRDLIFTGPQGRGKTYLLNAIGNALTSRGVDVCFVPATQMFSALVEYRKLRESFRPDPEMLETATARKRMIYESTALLIDDLGLEPLTPQTYADFIDVLNIRKQDKRHTVIATNQSYGDFEKNYDKRIASRLGAFAIYEVKGSDLRLSQRVSP